jgi:hypothetical protein
MLIPESEWDEHIERKNESDSWLKNSMDEIPCLDQNGLGYCHAYCTVTAMMAKRAQQNHPFVLLNAESIGGPITGWRNRGAHPEDDLDQAVEFGACPQSMVDRQHSISPSRWDSRWTTERDKYRISEWWDGELPGLSWEAAVTFTLLNIPFFSGHAWWSHAITGGFRLRKKNGIYQIEFLNSWGDDYGENGYFWMGEDKGTPDIGLFGVRSVVASG